MFFLLSIFFCSNIYNIKINGVECSSRMRDNNNNNKEREREREINEKKE